MANVFQDRREAGRVLAAHLARFRARPDVIVLALPRGGVPVGYEVARALEAPLDVFVVRKLGVPGQGELAMGAIASGGVRVLNRELVEFLRIDDGDIDRIAWIEQQELRRREAAYRGPTAPPIDVAGRTVIVVDDGLATGSTMRAAVVALRKLRAGRVVVAVPTAAAETCAELQEEADEVVCATTAEPFHAVGLWYHDFSQTTDDEVTQLLEEARHQTRRRAEERTGAEIPTPVPRERWDDFLDAFSREHEGWLVDVSVAEPDGPRRAEAREEPLRAIQPSPDGVRISLGGGQRVVEAPAELSFLADREGRHAGLAIDSANGRRTIVRFRSPARPETVDGYVAHRP